MDDRFLIQTAQNVDLAMAPAGLGERMLAWLVDGIVFSGYAIVVLYLLSDAEASDTAQILLVWVPFFVYHLAFEIFAQGQTPGKMLLRLRVARTDGAQPTLGQYLMRWMLRFVDITFSSGAIAMISVSVTRRSQRLGDLAAGTTVIRRRRRVRLEEVLYPPSPPGHVPEFLEADRLSDADVRTLRAVIVRLRLSRRDKRARAIADRAKAAVEARLGMEPVKMPAEAFLKSVVRDHTFLLDRDL
jgi:uncharacterized RDD family membrane protein YckC